MAYFNEGDLVTRVRAIAICNAAGELVLHDKVKLGGIYEIRTIERMSYCTLVGCGDEQFNLEAFELVPKTPPTLPPFGVVSETLAEIAAEDRGDKPVH